MKKTITLLLFLLNFIFLDAQTKNKRTIVVKKPDCFELGIYFYKPFMDTLALSEINSVKALQVSQKIICPEDHSFHIESYEMSINNSTPIHYSAPWTENNLFKQIKQVGTITITNCVIKIKTLNASDNIVIIPTKTFYIIRTKETF